MKKLHEIKQQNCFNEYCETDNKKYNGFEYFISDSKILYVYKCQKLVFSNELYNYDRKYLDSWAKWYIDRLPKTIMYNENTLINIENGFLYDTKTFELVGQLTNHKTPL